MLQSSSQQENHNSIALDIEPEKSLVSNVPAWHKNANIYEVHIRHYSPEGTFKAFQEHLPRLKDMGVNILWLMPIHPVSKLKSKGTMGSPYAVGDYYGINPDMGTMDDFKNLLREIHRLEMHCIIDWVPNHSGWDNPWIYQHPEWYMKGPDGEITDPLNLHTGEPWGWVDVADLNFDVPEMRQGMIDAMAFWIRDIGIDGFRVDVAHGVPLDFWKDCTDQLFLIKPIFMLAEAEEPALVNDGYFVMDYAWSMHHLYNDIAATHGVNTGDVTKLQQGNLVVGHEQDGPKKYAWDIDGILHEIGPRYQKGIKMNFTSNHDENSWAGSEFRRMGQGHKAFAVLSATKEGMPLIYSGQEAAMDKQLAFFDKDVIPWGDFAYHDFYKTILGLKKMNQALWNGVYGGQLRKVDTTNNQDLYAFHREKDGDQIVVAINFSNRTQDTFMTLPDSESYYKEVFTEEIRISEMEFLISLEPWTYRVYSNV
ncbi:MAG: alpha-amylase [Saprospiraceae bacterium]|jgi:alpha-amylase